MGSKTLDKVLSNTGTATDFRKGSVIGDIFRKNGLRATSEMQRIARLPRRNWQDLLLDNYAEKLSEHLRQPGSKVKLFNVQTVVLTEDHDYGGFLGNVGLGEGKTLLTALAPTLCGATRPVLLAPGGLRKKTERDFARYRREGWLVHPMIEFVSYEKLSRDPQILFSINPDRIYADEVHALKNLKAGCTKRVARFMRERPHTRFTGFSGTISTRSLMEFWHLLMWALRPENMPLPRNKDEVKEWALAVDEKVDRADRVAPGVLIDLLGQGLEIPLDTPKEDEDLVKARYAVRRRLEETAGYISTSTLSCNASISLEVVHPPVSRIIDEAIRELRAMEEDEHGEVMRPVEVWARARMLSCGFVYDWDPPPPRPWRQARLHWGRLVRYALIHYSRRLDTPLQVAQDVDAGRLTEPFNVAEPEDKPELLTPQEILARWRAEQPHYKYKLRPRWIDLNRPKWVVQRYLKPDEPIIVWVEHVAMGQMLAHLSGRPFYHEAGRNAAGDHIEDAQGPIIASVQANHRGINLQQYSNNFIVSCMPSGKIWEQLFGRTHRTGQLEDHITFATMEACVEHKEGLIQVLRDAQFAFQTQNTPQRLLLADKINL